MNRSNTIIICLLTIISSIIISCTKEPESISQSILSSPNPPIGTVPNNNPVDSLTGREFTFNDLSWTSDSMYVFCIINRPDLFYLPERSLDVSISINDSQWMKISMCPYPTDPFFYEPWPAGILKVYLYNYMGALSNSRTSIKVRFL